MKKIIFRADGDRLTGLGHLYRLFALIEILKNNFECVLITSENSTLDVIPKACKTMLIPKTVLLENEPGWLAEKYQPSHFNLVVDGYQFNSEYQKRIKNLGYKLVCIDDLANEHMFADLVINHSPGVSVQKYTAETYTKFALGTDFALVRPLFMEEAGKIRSVKIKDTAFVCFGGSDQFDFTTTFCKQLLKCLTVKKINIVIGGAYISNEILALQKNNPRVNVYKNLSETELLSVMKESNFAIVPTSTILFEVCSVNMPVLAGFYVDNQKEAYFSFLEEKAIMGAGDFKNLKASEIESLILSLLDLNTDVMLNAQSKLFDGKQKERYIEIFNNL